MARYRVLELSYINDHLHEPGVELDYDGLPGENLLPLDAAARKAAKAAEALALAAADFADSDGEEAAPVDLA